MEDYFIYTIVIIATVFILKKLLERGGYGCSGKVVF